MGRDGFPSKSHHSEGIFWSSRNRPYHGLTDLSPVVADVKKIVLTRCKEVIGVVDATKWGKVGLTTFATLEQIQSNCNHPRCSTRPGKAGFRHRNSSHRSIKPYNQRTQNMDQKKKYTPEEITALIEEQELTREEVLTGLRQMMEIRALENHIARLLGSASLKGASHLYAGEEAVAVGAISAIREDDLITSTHRGHGHCHAHGDKAAHTPETKQEHYNRMLAEVVGKAGGYCNGKGGSMHIADVVHGNLGATGIVSGNIPVATGAALAQKINKTDKVVLCFFGDGAVAHGNFHESLTNASMMDLPVVYIIENNLYGMSLPWRNASKVVNAADKAAAYGIPGEVVDGMDFLEVHAAVKKAVARARRGEGPTLIEAKTYRYNGHSHSDPRAYRTREEEAEWKSRDAIELLKSQLMDIKWATEPELEQMDAEISKKLQGAIEFSDESPLPEMDELYSNVFAPKNGQNRITEGRGTARKNQSRPQHAAIDLCPGHPGSLPGRNESKSLGIPAW